MRMAHTTAETNAHLHVACVPSPLPSAHTSLPSRRAMLIESGVLPRVMACLKCQDAELQCLAAGVVAALCEPPSKRRQLDRATHSLPAGDGRRASRRDGARTPLSLLRGVSDNAVMDSIAAELGDNPHARRRQRLDESTWGWIAGQVMVRGRGACPTLTPAHPTLCPCSPIDFILRARPAWLRTRPTRRSTVCCNTWCGWSLPRRLTTAPPPPTTTRRLVRTTAQAVAMAVAGPLAIPAHRTQCGCHSLVSPRQQQRGPVSQTLCPGVTRRLAAIQTTVGHPVASMASTPPW